MSYSKLDEYFYEKQYYSQEEIYKEVLKKSLSLLDIFFVSNILLTSDVVKDLRL